MVQYFQPTMSPYSFILMCLYQMYFAIIVYNNKYITIYIYNINYIVIIGVDETVVAILKYSKNRMAVITCSLGVKLPNDAIIMGTKGTVRVGHQRLN